MGECGDGGDIVILCLSVRNGEQPFREGEVESGGREGEWESGVWDGKCGDGGDVVISCRSV